MVRAGRTEKGEGVKTKNTKSEETLSNSTHTKKKNDWERGNEHWFPYGITAKVNGFHVKFL